MTRALAQRLLGAVRARPRLSLLVLALAAACVAAALSRVRLERDLLRLVLPRGAAAEAGRALVQNPLFESFYVDVAAGDRERAEGFAAALAERLAGAGIARGAAPAPGGAAAAGTMKLLFAKRFLLLRLPPGRREEALSPGALARALELSRMSLLSLQAPLVRERVAADPFDLFRFVEEDLKLAAGALPPSHRGGFPSTPDGRHVLVSFHPAAPPADFDASARMLERLRAVIRDLAGRAPWRGEGGVSTLLMGPHRFSAESGGAIRGDVTLLFAASSLLVLLLFLAFYRSLLPLLAASIVLGLSVAAAIGAAGLGGPVHGITLGFSSTLLGLAVDYAVHVRAAAARGWRRGGADRRAGALAETARLAPSLAGAWLTTGIVFLLLALSGFPLVRQLGVVGLAGVTAAFAAALLLVPYIGIGAGGRAEAGGARLAAATARLAAMGRGRAALLAAAFLVVLAALAAAIPRLRVATDVERLDERSPALAADFAEFQERWNALGQGDLVLARGATVEEALRRNDAVFEKLREGKARGLLSSFMSIAPLVPSVRAQEESAARLAEAAGAMRAALADGEERHGLDPAFFTPFTDGLARAAGGKEPPLEPAAMKGTLVERLLAHTTGCGEGGRFVLSSFIPAPGGRDPFLALLGADGKRVAWFNNRVFLGEVFRAMIDEVARTAVLCALAVLAYLLARYRSVPRALAAAAPLAFAIPGTLGLLALLGVETNAIGLLSLCLLAGLGIDYGIYMTDALGGGGEAGHAAAPVLLSALTTVAAFGALAFARSPVLRAMGLVVGIGIALALAAALLLVPALHALLLRRERR